MKKAVISVFLVVAVCLSLCGCGEPSKKDVLGTWEGIWTYNGAAYVCRFVLNDNDTYTYVTWKNGAINETLRGTWELDGSTVRLIEDQWHSLPYEYKDGCLWNGENKHKKVS